MCLTPTAGKKRKEKKRKEKRKEEKIEQRGIEFLAKEQTNTKKNARRRTCLQARKREKERKREGREGREKRGE